MDKASLFRKILAEARTEYIDLCAEFRHTTRFTGSHHLPVVPEKLWRTSLLDLPSFHELASSLENIFPTRGVYEIEEGVCLWGSRSALYAFLLNQRLIAEPEKLLKPDIYSIVTTFEEALARSEDKWSVRAFCLGLRCDGHYRSTRGWGIRPPTGDEIEALKQWGKTASPVGCYPTLTVIESLRPLQRSASWKEELIFRDDLYARLRGFILCLRLQVDLKVSTPLVLLENHSPFSLPALTSLRNESLFNSWDDPYDMIGLLPDEEIADQLEMFAQDYAKGADVDEELFSRIERHVEATRSLLTAHLDDSRAATKKTRKEKRRFNIAIDRYMMACDRLGPLTRAEEAMLRQTVSGDKSNTQYDETRLEQSLIDLWIALEALLGEKGKEEGVIARLARRVAILVQSDHHDAVDVERRAKESYNYRSNLVHGDYIDEELWGGISKNIRWLQEIVGLSIVRILELAPMEDNDWLGEIHGRLETATLDENIRNQIRGGKNPAILRPGQVPTNFWVGFIVG